MSRQLLFSNGVEDKREKRMYEDTIAVSVSLQSFSLPPHFVCGWEHTPAQNLGGMQYILILQTYYLSRQLTNGTLRK